MLQQRLSHSIMGPLLAKRYRMFMAMLSPDSRTMADGQSTVSRVPHLISMTTNWMRSLMIWRPNWTETSEPQPFTALGAEDIR